MNKSTINLEERIRKNKKRKYLLITTAVVSIVLFLLIIGIILQFTKIKMNSTIEGIIYTYVLLWAIYLVFTIIMVKILNRNINDDYFLIFSLQREKVYTDDK